MAEDRAQALLELLIGVSRDVATALDLRTVLQRLLFAAINNVGGERGSIVVMDDKGKPLDATIVYGKRFHEHTTQQLKSTVSHGLAGWVVQNRQSALVPDTSKDERWLHRPDDSAAKSGPKSAICVPLLAREQLVGVLTLVHPIPNTFGTEHLELMQAIADQASIAVLNARLYTESQRTARVMSALAEGAAAINSSLDTQDVWQRVLNQTMQALQVETVALALIEPTSGDLVFRASAGQNSGNIIGRHVPAGIGLIGMVAREGRGVVVSDIRQDKRYSEADRFGGIQTQAVAIAPIQAQGKVIGVLEAINPIAHMFDPDAVLVMTGLGSLAGTTIQNAQFLERLQQANRHYQELFEDSIDLILITDGEGRVLEGNHPAVKISGYSNQETHKLSIEQLHNINWDKVGGKFKALKEDSDTNYESVLHMKDGGTIPVEVHARRVRFEGTDSLQWILRDITARKELDALRDDMTHMIYHDLRSPLGNIVASLQMLSSLVEKDETVQTMLTIASNSTMRIQRLINSLLDINRLESGQQIVDQQAVNLTTLIEEAIYNVEPAATGRQQTINKDISADLPQLWVDTDMIQRVLINLLENAIKFTPSAGNVEIGARDDNGWVKVWIKDNGPGIPLADHERVFEKFTRLHGRDNPSGLGVGLAFCRLAVQGHGGRIWVKSEAGKGTTFWLTLPIVKNEQAGAPDFGVEELDPAKSDGKQSDSQYRN
jgi:two-component system, NtrC family, sensor histidine kinase KinB